MGLKVFLRTDETTSSVKVDGKRTRMLIKPNKKITGQGLFHHPCEDHSSPHPSIKAPMYKFDPDSVTGRYVGEGKFCPLCWTRLDQPQLSANHA